MDPERRILARLSEPGASRAWLPGTELPTEQRERGARRLGILGLLTAFTFVYLGIVYLYGGGVPTAGTRLATIPSVGSLVVILSSLGIFALSRRSGTDAAWLLKLGIAYQLVVALAIAGSRHFMPWPELGHERGWSGVAAAVIIFAVVVPSTPARTAWVSILVVLVDPLVLLATVAAGNPMPSARLLVPMFGPSLIAVLTAVVAAHINYCMGRRIQSAQELGSYKLVALLGQGGMGEVWRAEHKLLARPAAIKLIRSEALDAGKSPDEVVRRFKREAQATALLQSEHTIELYDFGIATDGSFYYVMELLDGLDLELAVRRHGPMPAERVVYLLRQVCDSLAEAHAHGLIHRDIKPANIYLCRRALRHDQVKVLDFGLVKPEARGIADAGTLTAEGSIHGTPAYMVPEIIEGKKEIDGRADLYAVGCVGYWLLSGKLVFEAASPMQMVIDHARTAPPPLSRRTEAEIPAALEALIHRCLEKDPARRPRSAGELGEELARIELTQAWTEERARDWWQSLEGAGPAVALDPMGTTAPLE